MSALVCMMYHRMTETQHMYQKLNSISQISNLDEGPALASVENGRISVKPMVGQPAPLIGMTRRLRSYPSVQHRFWVALDRSSSCDSAPAIKLGESGLSLPPGGDIALGANRTRRDGRNAIHHRRFVGAAVGRWATSCQPRPPPSVPR
jgi:hypothetical protein